MKLPILLETRSHSTNIFGDSLKRHYWQEIDFWLACLVGVVFWISFKLLDLGIPNSPPSTHVATTLYILVLVFPILEEIVFRGLIQDSIHKLIENAQLRTILVWPISNPNLLTSFCFSLSHMWSHSALWALATLFPSLVFGYFKDKYQSLYPAILLHIFYNLGFYIIL